jgi:uncharacterized protein (TIGR02453 family)
MIPPFTGFTPQAPEFLRQLTAHGSKAWFEEHRANYQTHLLAPFQTLVAEVGPIMLMIDPEFEIAPAVNKTLSRIYRDIRFSRDKTPFHGSMWLTFKRPQREWTDAPAYFMELFPDSYRYGMGFYSASAQTMACFRQAISDNSTRFLQAVSFYRDSSSFLLEGETYKRVQDASQPAELQPWFQRKSLYITCNRPLDELLFSPSLAAELSRAFELLAPLYHYLQAAAARAHHPAERRVNYGV